MVLASLILLLTFPVLIAAEPFSSSRETASADPKKNGDKIIIHYEARPKVVRPGDSGVIIIRLETPKGIKLTRYPQTSIQLSGDSELILEENMAKLGDAKMPDDIMKNALEKIDPVEFKFRIDEKAARDLIQVKASISYFYCETKSGLCAPGNKSINMQIPVKKR
ncbi:MAG: hypothetical protein AB1756_04950 [Acidobacteriota bacterium]